MTLLAEEAEAIALGTSVLVSMSVAGPGVSSSSSNPGNSAANSVLVPDSGSIMLSRLSLVYQSNFYLVRFLNSKLAHILF